MKKGSKKGKKMEQQSREPIVAQSISWEAPDFEYRPKDIAWYGGSFVVMLLLGAFAVWQGNFLFAIFLVIAWIVLLGFANREPSMWRFTLAENNISIISLEDEAMQRSYAYRDLVGFDIHDDDEQYKELILRSKSRLSPYVNIRIEKNDEEKIAMVLSKAIPRKEYGTSIADSLSKLVRF